MAHTHAMCSHKVLIRHPGGGVSTPVARIWMQFLLAAPSVPRFVIMSIMLVWGSACYAGESASGVVTLRVEGTAQGTDAAAVREADENGLLAAMGEYLEQYVPDGDLSVFHELLETPRRFVRSFNRVDTQVDEGVTVVTLRVSLDEAAIRQAAASTLFPRLAAQARFLVLVAERGIGDTQLRLKRDGIAGAWVVRALREGGLNDVRGIDAILDEDEDMLLTQLTDDTAIRLLLRENAADAAVVGRAYIHSDFAAAGSNLLEHRAELELRIVGAGEGAYTLRSEAKVLSGEIERGAQTALNDACAKVQGEVVPLSVLAVAQGGLGTGVLVVIRGPLDADSKSAIMERLKGVPGIGEVEVLREMPGVLKLHAPYTGEVGPLYRHLTWAPYTGFRLSAEQVVAREIRLEAIPGS